MQLTEHFSLEELTRSAKADELRIDNTPPSHILPKLNTLANGLEMIRTLLGHPMTISSGYRCPALNQAVGSKPTSQHMLGEAADFVCPAFGTPDDIVKALVASTIPFDQAITERSANKLWTHVSFGSRNRRVALIIDENGTRPFATA